MVVCSMQTTFAIPAYPLPLKVKQADGTMLTVTIRGDEYGHVVMTADGCPLVYNGATGNYEYATLQSGNIVASGIVASDAESRSAQATAFVKQQDKKAIISQLQLLRNGNLKQNNLLNASQPTAGNGNKGPHRISSNPESERLSTFPTTGEVHSLVILVQFADCKFSTAGSNVTQHYDDMLNQQGYTYSNGADGSVRDFFIDSSNGAFQPHYDVVGPVTLSKNYSYYGANKGSSTDNAERLEEFVREACTLADPLVDFSQYDLNNDGKVDNIFFYFAGYGEADSGNSNAIWPHSSTYTNMAMNAGLSTTTLTLDGKQVGNYTCSNEISGTTSTPQAAGIGTFVHEFGHVLGLVDHYDVYYGTATYTAGYYDTMDKASYNNNGNSPAALSAYERAVLGWTSLTTLQSNTDTLNILPPLTDSNKAYIVPVGGTQGKEYYIMENRQQKGWDTYIPGHGMLLWHIDYDADVWAENEVNITGSHLRVDLIEADNRHTENTAAGDPFPGTSNVTSYDLTSWAGDKVLSLDDIEEKDGDIRLMLGGLNLKLATPAVTFSEIADSSFTFEWPTVDAAKEYVMNIYKVDDNGNKTSVAEYSNTIFTEAQQVTVGGLQPESKYELSLQARRGSYSSDAYTHNVTTTAIPFSKKYVTFLQASDITANAFTASWQGIDEADDYDVLLSRLTYSDEATKQGYDFTGEIEAMPAGWSTDGAINLTYYGAETPSLRLNKAGSYINVSYANKRISSLHFYAQSSSSANATLSVQTLKNGEWQTVATLEGGASMKAGQEYEYNFDLTDAVRLYVSNRTSGAFYIDDIYASCHALQHTAVSGYDHISTNGKTSCSFSGLEENATYSVVVRGKQGTLLSYPSTELIVTPSSASAIDNIYSNQCSQSAEYYDINGRRINPSQLHHGIYIMRKDGKTQKIMK